MLIFATVPLRKKKLKRNEKEKREYIDIIKE